MDKLEVDSGVYSVSDGESCYPSPKDYSRRESCTDSEDDANTVLSDNVGHSEEGWSDDEEDERPYRRASTPVAHSEGDGRMRRSVSLRSALKSTHSPGRKKMVRFADAMGLDLEHIRHILQPDIDCGFSPMPPRGNTNVSSSVSAAKYIVPCFSLASSFNSDKTLRTQQVCVESITVTDFSVTGVLKVANLAFEKSVQVRYSLDRWCSWNEMRAHYIPHSSDGFVDKFVFTLFLPHDLPLYSTCELAVRYTADGQEHWDNNGGKNFVFECCGLRGSQTNCANSFLDHNWVHFL